MHNVNSSLPRVLNEKRAVTVNFNDFLFDDSIVRVMFSSNCTSAVTTSYSNPVMITIPDIESNTCQCQYSVNLIDGNSHQIGYPINGFFDISGN